MAMHRIAILLPLLAALAALAALTALTAAPAFAQSQIGPALAETPSDPALAETSSDPAPPDFLGERETRAELMFVGAFHFSYPNLDAHKPAHFIDVLAPERQRELEEIVDRLAGFCPTKVAVEVRTDRQAELDSLYVGYVAGTAGLRVGEEYQIGFRLARRLGHARVHAIDTERHVFFVDLAKEQLAPREEELLATDREWRDRFRRLYAHEDSLVAANAPGLVDMFVAMNAPERIRRSHLPYAVGFFKFDGEEGGYTGADFVSGWYNRNLRIFRNLQRITDSPEERILVLIGSGHLPILRFVAEHSPEYDVVEANDYLQRGETAAR